MLFLRSIGVSAHSAATIAFDPGYDPLTLESHLKQSGHFLSGVKLSMATWQLAAEDALRSKVLAARSSNVPLIAGGGAFEVAIAFG
jgi:phosphosulfolactate synthase